MKEKTGTMADYCQSAARRLAVVGCVVLCVGCSGVPSGPQRGGKIFNLVASMRRQPARPAAPQKTDSMPVTFETEMARASNLVLAKRFDEARPIYERLVEEYPDRYQPYHRLAVVADHQQQHREAEKLYFQAIRLDRNDAELFNDLGYCLYSQGKLPQAQRILNQAVTMNPQSARYRNNLGLVLGHLGRYDEALEQFQRSGRPADAHYNVAVIRAAGGDLEAARQDLRQALDLDPKHARASETLASWELRRAPLSEVAADTAVAEAGIRWVPYVEGGVGGPFASIEPVSYDDIEASSP